MTTNNMLHGPTEDTPGDSVMFGDSKGITFLNPISVARGQDRLRLETPY